MVSQRDCERYDMQFEQWFVAPELRIARHSHSTSALGNFIYVFCGYRTGTRLNSIEQLDVAAELEGNGALWWQITTSSELPKRAQPITVPISSTQIMIMGGSGDSGLLSDICIYETICHSVRLHISSIREVGEVTLLGRRAKDFIMTCS